MTHHSYRSSRADNWTSPRPYSDANLRLMKHGKVRPMREPTWLQRLLGER